jgi:hypothetical protein
MMSDKEQVDDGSPSCVVLCCGAFLQPWISVLLDEGLKRGSS